MKINLRSEIGKLEGVLIHTPGPEVENMTPESAERALYSDILSLSVAQSEYALLVNLLESVTTTYQVCDLFESILSQPSVKKSLVLQICEVEGCPDLCENLLTLPEKVLARLLIEGVAMPRDNLTRFLSKERFSLPPLHNFFFTRDAAMAIMDEVLIGRMAKPIRWRESVIMAAIFNHSPRFSTHTVNPIFEQSLDPAVTIEGGDVLVARDDILVIGTGSRTSSQGIDFIIEHFKAHKDKKRHILVQELPHSPESFIHLYMVFTLLDHDCCMVFEPLMLRPNKYQTIHITIDNGRVTHIREEKLLIDALRHLDMDLTPIICGGKKDLWTQEREQWHSGTNFFALAPGKVVGYARNVYTIAEMNQAGFNIINAEDIISGHRRLEDEQRCVITLEGSELPRGGGGARCMTMPIRRQPVSW